MHEPLPTSLRVPPEDVGERLDHFLAKHLPDHSRSAITRLIEAGRVQVSGKLPTKAGHPLKVNDEVVLEEVAEPAATGHLAQNIPLTLMDVPEASP